jgi:SAM-dependent methyltransferase
MDNSKSKGILNQPYAFDRINKPELIYRYKVRARIVSDAAKRYLGEKSNLKILDFGSAEGLTLLELNELLPNSSFLGIEYSEELIQCAPKLPENIRIIYGDVCCLGKNVKNESYDVVSALAILEHLPNPLKAVSEAVNILQPGGLFIATCPNPLWDDISTTLGLLQDDQHETDFDKKGLINIIGSAGLEFLAFDRFMWAPISVLPYMKIPISPLLSLKLDRIIRSLKLFNFLFVNQCIIARKPLY